MLSIGSPKNFVASLLLDLEQPALDGADARRRDVAVLRPELRTALSPTNCSIARRSARLSSRSPLSSAMLEDHREHAFLRFVEVEQTREEQRTHVGDGGAHGMSLLAEQVPEGGGAAAQGRCREDRSFWSRSPSFSLIAARLADAAQISLHVGEEYRHADARKLLGEHLQRDGLAGAGGTGDEAVAVAHGGEHGELGVAGLGNDERVGHAGRMGATGEGRQVGQGLRAASPDFPG